MSRFILILLLLNNVSGFAQTNFRLEEMASGFSQPVSMTHAGDERLFIVEKRGTIRVLQANGQVLPTPFLNITTRVNAIASERGLLGLAFHPDYPRNGYFFVNYTNNQGHTHISRFQVRSDNPNEADANSEQVLLVINQPFSNHNAGDLAFGPDGYLYIGTGDGGSGGDPQNVSQNRQSLLGKMLRLDVNGSGAYAIPSDNPFVDDPNTRNEIWALGLRNPWRFSFDRLTGELWIADVGQGGWEEINVQPANSSGGENYGWRCYEGDANFNTGGCGPRAGFTFPVHIYPNQGANGAGCSITGGYVYRGSAFPSLQGQYIYADYCSGRFWSLRTDGQGGWVNTEWLNLGNFEFVAFGEDHRGELYVASISSGRIFRIAVAESPTAVADELQLKRFVLAPNPTQNLIRLEIEVENATTYQFRLLDATAQTIREWQDSVGSGYAKTVDMQTLPAGIYFLQIQKGAQTLVRRVLKL